MHEPWRLRVTYAYSYSDSDHFYFHEKRVHAIERAPTPSTLVNEHTVIAEWDIPWKLSLVAEIPFVYTRQRRETGAVAGTMTATGLGDLRLLTRYWITDENPRFRLYASLGVRLPTGESNQKFNAQNSTRVTQDVAAQAGTGNAAGIFEFGGTSELLEKVALFFQGRYIFTPATETDANNFRWELSGNGPRKNSDSDAATLRIGANLGVGSFIREQIREEPIAPLDSVAIQAIFDAAWVPYDDVFGATEGFRRSAIILFAGPGITWAPNENLTLSAATPIVVYRKIQRNGGNVPEWVFQASATITF